VARVVELEIRRNAPIPTWFGVGGGADRLVEVREEEVVRHVLEADARARVLGDGANLLVDDDGVGEIVLAMKSLRRVEWLEDGRVVVQAGADLGGLVSQAVRRGLGGIEGLAGIPATIGGAVRMNAGGTWGQIADVVEQVHGYARDGSPVSFAREQIPFGYRRSGLEEIVITRVELRLSPGNPDQLRARMRHVMEIKKGQQPLAAPSAGCCYKNPVVSRDLADERGEIGKAGQRIPAGLLIDRCGLKGLRVGKAVVSERHANFLIPEKGATARDLISLMEEVEARVFMRLGVRLEREVVVWSRHVGY
jgi:UDP-N-acetylmuramate dehydrogenase